MYERAKRFFAWKKTPTINEVSRFALIYKVEIRNCSKWVQTLKKYEWSRLNKLQIGKYAEYFVKMEFTQHDFDVYSSEVDDRGIDFVVRKEPSSYYDVQVKSVRESGYVFFPKRSFRLRKNLFAAIVVFIESQLPKMHLIPSEAWKKPDALLRDHEYIGKKSEPEWGLNISKKNMSLLSKFAFEDMIGKL